MEEGEWNSGKNRIIVVDEGNMSIFLFLGYWDQSFYEADYFIKTENNNPP